MRNRLLLLSLYACTLLACDSANPVAPTGTVLSVIANPSRISLSGESARITVAGFKPDGNPLNPGTQVLLSTNLGALFDSEFGGSRVSTIAVGGNGQAIAYLRGDGRQGNAEVMATLPTGGDAMDMATVQIGAGMLDRESLIISANPGVIDIGEVSTITVIARAADNSPLGAGQRVRFTTTLGVLEPDAKDTDANGEVEVELRAISEAGTATVEAILGTSAPASTMVTIRDAAASIGLTSVIPPAVPVEGGSLSMRAVVRNAQGDGFGGAAVNFSAVIVGGERGGLNIGILTSQGGAVLTDSQGEATDTLTIAGDELTDANSGDPIVDCIDIRAEVGGANGSVLSSTLRLRVGTRLCPP